jgi:hypothetical protein
MKHLLNNISQEEKNRILEQHRGGKSIDTTRFKALLESKSGNVKPLIMERPTGTQPKQAITPVVTVKPNPSVGTKPKQAITPAVTVKPNTIAKERNWVKVIAYSDEAATQAFININIDSQMIKLVGNDVKFNYIVAGKPQEEGIGTFYCNSKNTMSFDGKPLTGTMYISDARVDTLKSKCGSNQGYASTNTVVDKNFA